MIDKFDHVKVGDKDYPFAFNINVLQAITHKYGKKDGLTKWSNLVQPSNKDEPDLEAIVFLAKECINEGIDMENDEESEHYVKREIDRKFISEKQAARIISKVEGFNSFAFGTIANSMGESSKETNNEKN